MTPDSASSPKPVGNTIKDQRDPNSLLNMLQHVYDAGKAARLANPRRAEQSSLHLRRWPGAPPSPEGGIAMTTQGDGKDAQASEDEASEESALARANGPSLRRRGLLAAAVGIAAAAV